MSVTFAWAVYVYFLAKATLRKQLESGTLQVDIDTFFLKSVKGPSVIVFLLFTQMQCANVSSYPVEKSSQCTSWVCSSRSDRWTVKLGFTMKSRHHITATYNLVQPVCPMLQILAWGFRGANALDKRWLSLDGQHMCVCTLAEAVNHVHAPNHRTRGAANYITLVRCTNGEGINA